jgi:hypothetical protein
VAISCDPVSPPPCEAVDTCRPVPVECVERGRTRPDAQREERHGRENIGIIVTSLMAWRRSDGRPSAIQRDVSHGAARLVVTEPTREAPLARLSYGQRMGCRWTDTACGCADACIRDACEKMCRGNSMSTHLVQANKKDQAQSVRRCRCAVFHDASNERTEVRSRPMAGTRPMPWAVFRHAQ